MVYSEKATFYAFYQFFDLIGLEEIVFDLPLNMDDKLWFLTWLVPGQGHDIRKLDPPHNSEGLIDNFIDTNVLDGNSHSVDIPLPKFIVLRHKCIVHKAVLVI